MDVIEELDDPHVPIAQACEALGVSRATLYRQTRPAPPRPAPSPRRLSDPERKAVLDVLHSDEFVDLPPSEVYATLLSRGVYLAPIRTMCRLLAASGAEAQFKTLKYQPDYPDRFASLTHARSWCQAFFGWYTIFISILSLRSSHLLMYSTAASKTSRSVDRSPSMRPTPRILNASRTVRPSYADRLPQ